MLGRTSKMDKNASMGSKCDVKWCQMPSKGGDTAWVLHNIVAVGRCRSSCYHSHYRTKFSKRAASISLDIRLAKGYHGEEDAHKIVTCVHACGFLTNNLVREGIVILSQTRGRRNGGAGDNISREQSCSTPLRSGAVSPV